MARCSILRIIQPRTRLSTSSRGPGKVVSAVCYRPTALVNVKLADSSYLIKDKEVTGFSNVEEEGSSAIEREALLVGDVPGQ